MKRVWKHLLLIPLAVCLAAGIGLSAAACEKTETPQTHTQHVDSDGDGKCDVCGENVSPSAPHTQHVDSDSDGKCDVCGEAMGTNPGQTAKKETYTVTLLRSSGDPLPRVTFLFLGENGVSAGYATTDENGVARADIVPGNYTVTIANLPDGYIDTAPQVNADEREYTFRFSASVITDEEIPADKTYTLGDVMYDFSFRDITGKNGSLSGLLSTHKAVLLNFFFTTCGPCIQEFPDLVEAWQTKTDGADFEKDIAVLPITPISNLSDTITFAADMGLPFSIVANNDPVSSELATRFGVGNYPTSVIIDREGVVCFMAAGMGTKNDFLNVFEKYSAEPYEQDIMFPGEGVPRPVPVPSESTPEEIAAALDNTGSGFSAEYYFVPEGQEAQHEYIWEWEVTQKDGRNCIVPKNIGVDDTFAMLYADVIAQTGQVITFDYKTSSEENGDELSVFVNNILIFTDSGVSNEWKTCYAYVPNYDGKYTIAFVYGKDVYTAEGDDCVYISNLRFSSADDITTPVQTTYFCADGTLDENGMWTNYADVFYNEEDGYYHVGNAEGPLVLANLMETTHFSDSQSAWQMVMNGGFTVDGVDYTSRMTDFCQYANNSEKYGFVGVTEELKTILEALTQKYSARHHDKEWLELCSYVVGYGTLKDQPFPDPARGLAAYSAFKAVEYTGEDISNPNAIPENERNHVVINRILVPRGLWYEFIPETSAIYLIQSISDGDTYAWLRNSEGEIIMENDDIEFLPDDILGSDGNFRMIAVLEAGKPYYICCASADVNATDEQFDFFIKNIGTEKDIWKNASAGEYTWEIYVDENGDEQLGDFILKGAVDLELKDDVYYAKGSNHPVYVNLANSTTSMFPDLTIEDLLDYKFFYCTECYSSYLARNSQTQPPEYCIACGGENFMTTPVFRLPRPTFETDDEGNKHIVFEVTLVGDQAFYFPVYEKDEDGNVIFDDYTEEMKEYIERSKTEFPTLEGDNSHHGFLAAEKGLVDILYKFIVFGDLTVVPSIDNAWLMLAAYYEHLQA